jgi:hypothetical protein
MIKGVDQRVVLKSVTLSETGLSNVSRMIM